MASINQIKRSAYINKYLQISSESSEPIIVKKHLYTARDAGCRQQGHADSKTLHQHYPPFFTGAAD